ncbi:MAG: hypothetical protein JOZ39_08620 [Chloroflexi bacterium]|nr:hypothetical protein [Chloroflexota bacterium]
MAKPEDILDRLLSGELNREDAIAQRPDMEDRLTLLGDLADELRSLPSEKPSAEYRLEGRMRLLRHIRETQQREPWWRRWRGPVQGFPGWASGAAAVVLASGVMTAGVSYASASALPDDALYPVKRAVENVQVAMAVSDEARANQYLDQADHRAAELATVAGDVEDSKLASLTSDYGSALQSVGVAVQKLPDPSPQLLTKVQSHVASQATEIEARSLNSQSQPRVQQRLTQAEVVASSLSDRVTLVAEKRGQPGPQDVHLAANPAAAATAAAEPEHSTPAGMAPSPQPSEAGHPALQAANPPASPPQQSQTTKASDAPRPAATAAPSPEGQLDVLWNEVAAAPFMAQKVRLQLEADVANAKRDVQARNSSAALQELNAFDALLTNALKDSEVTQYTVNRLTAQAKSISAGLNGKDLGLRPAVVAGLTGKH